jgi:hypothetical protein
MSVLWGSEVIFICNNILAMFYETKITVPDLGSRIRNVVLVRRMFGSGKPQGVGILKWGGNG